MIPGALCLPGSAPLAAAGGLGPLLAAMLAAGLAAGVTHCAGMCAPFVLAQGAARAAASDGTALARLSGAALLPYQCGRVLGYAALGALAGGTGGLVAGGAARPLLALPLLLAAAVMAREGCARLGHVLPAGWTRSLPRPRLPQAAERAARALLLAPTGLRGVALGLFLSLLPCGAIYAALAAAAASGSAAGGALCAGAFALGTVPALLGVGLLGQAFGRGLGAALRPAAAGLFLANALLLAALALRVGGAA